MSKATKSNTLKLVCAVTKDWAYCTRERHDELRKKFGSLAKLEAGYICRRGKKLIDAEIQLLLPKDAEGKDLEGEALSAAIAAVRDQATENVRARFVSPETLDGDIAGKNKLFCILTGQRMYISDERMAHLMAKGNCSEEEVRAKYLSRVARRLCKSLPSKMFQKEASELTEEETAQVHAEIKKMADEGKLPAPSAPKGSVKAAAEAAAIVEAEKAAKAAEPVQAKKTSKTSKKSKSKKVDVTEVIDIVPAEIVTEQVEVVSE